MKILASVAALAAMLAGCDACSRGERAAEDAGRAEAESDAARPERPAETLFDAGVDPSCTGAKVDLAAALASGRCATSSGDAKALRAAYEANAAAGGALVQEAKRAEDGRVELRLVNRGTAPVALPLSYHPKIPAFVVLADEAKGKELYELATPKLDVPEDEAGAARFARIVLPPSGVAVARIAIDATIVRRVDKRDAGAGAKVPPRLGPGLWTLHIGQLVTDVETGDPATLAWSVAP